MKAEDEWGGFRDGKWVVTHAPDGYEVEWPGGTPVGMQGMPKLEKGVQAELRVALRGVQGPEWHFPDAFAPVNHHFLLTFKLGRELRVGDPVGVRKPLGVIHEISEDGRIAGVKTPTED